MYFDTSDFESYDEFEDEALESLREGGEIFVSGPESRKYGVGITVSEGWEVAKSNLKTSLRNPIKGLFISDHEYLSYTTTDSGVKLSYTEL